MNMATLNKIYQALRLVPFLIMFIGIGLLATNIIEPNIMLVSIIIGIVVILQFAMTIIKFILSRAGFSTSRKGRGANPGSPSGGSTGVNPGFGSSTSFTSSAVFGGTPENPVNETLVSPSSADYPTAESPIDSASGTAPISTPIYATGAPIVSAPTSDPSQYYDQAVRDLLLIENVFAIDGTGTVVSGTLLRALGDGDRILVKTAKGNVYDSQVSGLQIWRDGELKTTTRAIMEDVVSFRLENIDASRIAAGDKVCSIG